jgi:hypothetical protein
VGFVGQEWTVLDGRQDQHVLSGPDARNRVADTGVLKGSILFLVSVFHRTEPGNPDIDRQMSSTSLIIVRFSGPFS